MAKCWRLVVGGGQEVAEHAGRPEAADTGPANSAGFPPEAKRPIGWKQIAAPARCRHRNSDISSSARAGRNTRAVCCATGPSLLSPARQKLRAGDPACETDRLGFRTHRKPGRKRGVQW